MIESVLSQPWDVPTPHGMARVHPHLVPGRARATLVLGHGIGGGISAPDLVALAANLPAEGIEVLLVEQPWRVLGQRLGGPPETLDAAWIAVLEDIRSRGLGWRRLVVGGRSAGARVACRTVSQIQPDAVLALAFPLHRARRALVSNAQSRIAELAGAAGQVPTVVVQGTRDPMGAPDEIAAALAEAGVIARVVPVSNADHYFAVPASDPGGNRAAIALLVRVARAVALKLAPEHY